MTQSKPQSSEGHSLAVSLTDHSEGEGSNEKGLARGLSPEEATSVTGSQSKALELLECELPEFDYEIDGDAILADQSVSVPQVNLPERIEATPDEEATRARLRELEAEMVALHSQLNRLQADYESLRRRSERQQSELRQQVCREIMTQLLPLIDNFERALGYAMSGPVGEDFISGVVLIYKQLMDLLERHEVVPISAVGKIFDPEVHEAVAIEPRPGYEANTVVAEIEKGYTIGKRLLRPARVKVAIRPEAQRGVKV